MFEFSVALKYLMPRRRQLSVSIIAIVSVFVISMVVWLILVFFSVTTGLEKIWTDKLIAMTAPIRLNPTNNYYDSYYYKIDVISSSSDYTAKSVGEKYKAPFTDPYNGLNDMEIPSYWPLPHHDSNGDTIDPVKGAFNAITSLAGIRASDYEYAIAQMHLKTIHNDVQTSLTQSCYLSAFDEENSIIDKIIIPDESNTGLTAQELITPDNITSDENVFVTKHFRESGVVVGDRGYLSYYAPTAGALQEQRISIRVAGFYDPGIIPLGGKFVIAGKEVTSLISAATNHYDTTFGNGINVWFSDTDKASTVKESIIHKLRDAGIDKYWNVQTFKEYDFTKDLVEQLQSERLLFTLIAVIIIIVACSNIVSMLILLVNDKKKEIGILQSMGASPKSIALIFGSCGVLMGLLSTGIGTIAALFTLANLDVIIGMLSAIQGHAVFNSAFYGDIMPHELDFEIVRFILISTGFISLIAGVVPALKASLMKPAEILRSE